MTGRLRTRDLPVFPLTADPVRIGVGPAAALREHPSRAMESSEGPRISVITLGCDKNTVDSERMMAALAGQGARVTDDLDGADVVIVNTCGFIEAAKEESVETLLEACALKEEGRVGAVVAVGCMVQRYKEELSTEIPEVDLFLGLTDMHGLVQELERRRLIEVPPSAPNMEVPLRILSTETPHTSYLKISEGCDHTCAFCAIPHMRGLHRSAPLEELVRETLELEASGVKEINVVSQDTTWYGRDLRRRAHRERTAGRAPSPAPLLPDLLRALLERTSVPWFRLFYMYPSGLTPEMVELIASHPRLLPYLDMPIQHGSDAVLTRMRRPERRHTIRERVAWLRASIPDIVLRTTVIVGFPGETDEEFGETLQLLEELEFDRVGSFTYSVEEGTPAAEMRDQVPESTKRERLETLMDLQREISFTKNEALLGRRERLLVDRRVEEEGEFVAEGRIRTQAIEVDGLTHIVGTASVSGEARRHDVPLEPGDFLDVEVVEALDHDLVARVVE